MLIPKQLEFEIYIWGKRFRQYLKYLRKVKYYNMLTQCKLYPHLADVEQRAYRMNNTCKGYGNGQYCKHIRIIVCKISISSNYN